MDLIESQYNYNTNEHLRDPILVISWIYKQSVWTETNGVSALETCVFSVSSKR